MPRPTKGRRLWYRKPKRATADRPAEAGGWVILDGKHQHRTGCSKGDRQGAEGALAEYITSKHEVPRRQRRLADIPIADVLNLYLTDVVPGLRTALKASGRIDRLIDWWGGMKLDEVTGAACRQFTATRTPGAARRELQDLQAAISYHHKEGLHRELVRVSLPPAGAPRERWLTRDEVARLLRVCLHTREQQDGAATKRRPLRHLARFILFAVYTGSRPGDVTNASFVANSERSVIAMDAALFYRKPTAKLSTKKKQPTTPIPPRLMAHLRRWRDAGAIHVVEHGNASRSGAARESGVPEALGSIKTAFYRAVELAGLGADVVPYTLRHTAATWMLRRGVKPWEVAGYLGTSEAMVERHYGHHSVDNLRNAAAGVSERDKPSPRKDTQRNGARDAERNEKIRLGTTAKGL